MKSDSRKQRHPVVRGLRLLWRTLKAINTLVFGALSLLLLAALLFAIISQRGPEVAEGTALLVNPSGNLVEQQTALETAALLQGSQLPQQTLVRDVTDALALAREDARISSLVLDLSHMGQAALPMLETIVGAMREFQASGKSILAMADSYSQSALYLAAHADEVLLDPEGMGLPQGFAMYRSYFGSLLQEQEVTVNLFKVGDYKSAADPFVLDGMSDEERASRQAVLEAWWQSYTSAIETARDLPDGRIDALLQNAAAELERVDGNPALLSLESGLVDQLMSDAERRDWLVDRVGEGEQAGEYRKIGYRSYLRGVRQDDASDKDKVAVITAVGNIVDGRAPAGQIGSRSLIERIRDAREDEQVKAIVLRIDSGGGSKSASEMIRSELQAAQEQGLPVVASMGAVAASGGYWIASTADEIWASATTVTGSIGIFGLLPTFERTLARYGIYSDGVATTPIAGGVDLTRALSPAFREVLQTVIESGYQQFLAIVSRGRGMSLKAVDQVAGGRIWTGTAARDNGLVDELGDLEDAILAAATLAELDQWSVWHVMPEASMEEQILRRLSETRVAASMHASLTGSSNPVSRLLDRARRELAPLSKLNDPRHAYVICMDCPLPH